jgi:hypothetical protein
VIIDQHYLWVFVALDVVLLFMILAGLAKKQLEWKRPVSQPISRRHRDDSHRLEVRTLPRWLRDFLIVGTAIGGAAAIGASLAGAVTPPLLLAYILAAILVIFATG